LTLTAIVRVVVVDRQKRFYNVLFSVKTFHRVVSFE
jgi:hypothetical protein